MDINQRRKRKKRYSDGSRATDSEGGLDLMVSDRMLELLKHAADCFHRDCSPFSTGELSEMDVTADECRDLSSQIGDIVEEFVGFEEALAKLQDQKKRLKQLSEDLNLIEWRHRPYQYSHRRFPHGYRLIDMVSVSGRHIRVPPDIVEKHFPGRYAKAFYDLEKKVLSLQPSTLDQRRSYKLTQYADNLAYTCTPGVLIRDMRIKNKRYDCLWDDELKILLFEVETED